MSFTINNLIHVSAVCATLRPSPLRFRGILKESKMPYGQIREALGLPPRTNLKTHRTYRIWYSARSRCRWRAHHAYARYGGKGVKLCQRWESFLNFLEDMGHPPTEKHTLDRIDPDGDYSPDNCRWATCAEQNRNKTSTLLVDGVCLKDAAAAAGIKYATVWARINRGWPVATALSVK